MWHCINAERDGRVAFQRHDYEGVSSAGGEAVMRNLEAKLAEAQAGHVAEVASAENFSWADILPTVFIFIFNIFVFIFIFVLFNLALSAATSTRSTAAPPPNRVWCSNSKPETSLLRDYLARAAAARLSGAFNTWSDTWLMHNKSEVKCGCCCKVFVEEGVVLGLMHWYCQVLFSKRACRWCWIFCSWWWRGWVALRWWWLWLWWWWWWWWWRWLVSRICKRWNRASIERCCRNCIEMEQYFGGNWKAGAGRHHVMCFRSRDMFMSRRIFWPCYDTLFTFFSYLLF